MKFDAHLRLGEPDFNRDQHIGHSPRPSWALPKGQPPLPVMTKTKPSCEVPNFRGRIGFHARILRRQRIEKA